MGDSRKEQKIERQAISTALKMKHQRQDRRSKFWIYGTGSVLILALVGTVVSVMVVEQQKKDQLLAAASKPIDGVQSSTELSRGHTSSPIAFSEMPPMGGDHAPTWINCGTYMNPINPSEALHSLEHGAVWVTYRPDLPQKEIDALTRESALHPYQLLSPYPGLSSPVVATAWGKQLKLESADDPRLSIFLQAHLQGPQTPEPGAPCSGGVQG